LPQARSFFDFAKRPSFFKRSFLNIQRLKFSLFNNNSLARLDLLAQHKKALYALSGKAQMV
jgi:hypothetical protein